MEATMNLYRATVYVGTFGKYAEGSLAGKWLDLSDYDDLEGFYEACRTLHSDESDPEFMFQDHEEVPDALINESHLSPLFFPLREALGNLGESQVEAFFIWLSWSGLKLEKEDPDDLVSRFEDQYIGEYDSEEEYARQYIEENYDFSPFILTYFDYESFGRDLFMGDLYFESGHVFSS